MVEEFATKRSVAVQPQSSFTAEDLVELTADLGMAFPGYDVSFVDRPEMRGYGVTWWEGVRIILEHFPEALVSVAVERSLDAGVAWMRRRFKGDFERYNRPRPKVVRVLDATGKELGNIALKSGRHKPVSYEDAMEKANAPQPRRKKNGKKGKVKKHKKDKKDGKNKHAKKR